jgi:hypothetical protein
MPHSQYKSGLDRKFVYRTEWVAVAGAFGILGASVRNAEVNSRRSVFCSGPLDLRAQAEVRSARRTDTLGPDSRDAGERDQRRAEAAVGDRRRVGDEATDTPTRAGWADCEAPPQATSRG